MCVRVCVCVCVSVLLVRPNFDCTSCARIDFLGGKKFQSAIND